MNIVEQTLNHYGHRAQITQAMEEMGELTAALNRVFFRQRGELADVVEEIADVEIMMAQLRLIVGANLVAEAKLSKLERLAPIVYHGDQADPALLRGAHYYGGIPIDCSTLMGDTDDE